jgi:ribosomal protein S18 acetylase RimI-like enzyme
MEHEPAVHVTEASGQVTDPGFVTAAHRILDSLVRDGAALGWVEPPSATEVAALLRSIGAGATKADASLCAAYSPGPSPATGPGPATGPSPATGPGHFLPSPRHLVGLGYWTRYERPTHRPHADMRRIAVAAGYQGHGVGRALIQALVASARAAQIEMLTLDVRGDNTRALHLYESLGFTEYGRLKDFVAVGSRRYDMVLYALDLRELQAR